jgi:hypothetical protein
MRQSKFADAEPLLARVTAVERGKAPDETYRRYAAAHGLCLAKLERWPEADAKLREAYELMARTDTPTGKPDKRLLPVVTALVKVSRAMGNESEAQRWSQIERSLATSAPASTPSR